MKYVKNERCSKMESVKIIHYCWFGGKELPELTQKCIESWKKYFPNYKIIMWSEENFNINENKFIKEAYKNKMWAFVSDYTRTKVLNEYGGIYFDTDMEVIKDIQDVLKYDTVLGLEDTGLVGVGFWYEKYKKSKLTKKMLEIYDKFDGFNIKETNNYIITKLISSILKEDGLDEKNNKLQVLNNNIAIYPREYFYPYSYNDDKLFTDNTCMIHYYNGSWIKDYEKKADKIQNKIIKKFIKKFGKKQGNILGKIFFYITYYPVHPISFLKKIYNKIKK